MTDQVNPVLKKAEDLFKTLAWDTLVQAALVALKIDFWPLNVIFEYFSEKLYELTRLQFDMAMITFINAEHEAAFDKAEVTLKILGQQKGVDSPEYQAAKENAKNALSKFVRFGDTA